MFHIKSCEKSANNRSDIENLSNFYYDLIFTNIKIFKFNVLFS